VAGPAAVGELSPRVDTALAGARVERLRAIAPDDDRALRALLRRSVIPGAVRVAFTREPAYAAGEGVAGAVDHLVVARDAGAIVGMGRCSVRTLYRNGRPERVGYLGELRLAEASRRGTRLLREGYRALAEAMSDDGIQAYFTSITSDNRRARTVLEHAPRLGLPAYTPLAELVTLVAPVARGWQRAPARDAAAAAAVPSHDLAATVSFLDRAARQQQLALPWSALTVRSLASHGVSPADFVALAPHGTLAGAAALWDQRPFRQVVVDGYGGALRWGRALANVALRLAGSPLLPAPGEVLAQGALLGATVAAPEAWHALWPLVAHAAARRRMAWVAIARDARDPELEVLRPLLRAREYHTTLYDVALAPAVPPWDGRLVRPEVGLL